MVVNTPESASFCVQCVVPRITCYIQFVHYVHSERIEKILKCHVYSVIPPVVEYSYRAMYQSLLEPPPPPAKNPMRTAYLLPTT